MRAIRVEQFGGPEELHLVDVPDPVPGPGDVAVQLHAAGVNPVDAYVRTGQYARLPQLPYTPGADGAGVITALGEGVTTRSVGDAGSIPRPRAIWYSATSPSCTMVALPNRRSGSASSPRLTATANPA